MRWWCTSHVGVFVIWILNHLRGRVRVCERVGRATYRVEWHHHHLPVETASVLSSDRHQILIREGELGVANIRLVPPQVCAPRVRGKARATVHADL